jgi:hypothetical protein
MQPFRYCEQHNPFALVIDRQLLGPAGGGRCFKGDGVATARSLCPGPLRSSSFTPLREGGPCRAQVLRIMASTACLAAPAMIRFPASSRDRNTCSRSRSTGRASSGPVRLSEWSRSDSARGRHRATAWPWRLGAPRRRVVASVARRRAATQRLNRTSPQTLDSSSSRKGLGQMGQRRLLDEGG